MKNFLNSHPWVNVVAKLLATLTSIGMFSILGVVSYLFGAVALDTLSEDESVVVTIIVFVATGIAILSLNTLLVKLISKVVGVSESGQEISERNKLSTGLIFVLPIVAFTFGFFRADLAPIWSVEARAAAYYRSGAKAGDAEAQKRLGDYYRNGYGLYRSKSTAVFWWRKAAKQGHSKAQSSMGFVYANGIGVKINYREAVHWYSMSAEQGNPYSLNQLGTLYREGKGVAKSYPKAIKLFTKGAFQGDAWSIASLAYMHETGLGVKKSRENAIKFYRLSADKNNLYAKSALKRLKASAEDKNNVLKGLRSSITPAE